MKYALIIFFAFVSFFGFAGHGVAQNYASESIVSFSSEITVAPDNSVAVKETIVYDAGPDERRGIYRDIVPVSSQGKVMDIINVQVVDEFGKPHPFEIIESYKNFRIKIGDPDVTFSGTRTYVVSYVATRAVGQFEKFDEIYWNVTGNGWNMPIQSGEAMVHLPDGAQFVQSACYAGPKGSTETCNQYDVENGAYPFRTAKPLESGEGLTIALGFSKGIVTPYTASENTQDFLALYWTWFVGGALLLLTSVYSITQWYRHGRDARGLNPIVPQYDVPDRLTPLEVGGIMKERVLTKNISAEIVYLATHGYLQIKQIGEKAGIFSTVDYELIKRKSFDDLPNQFDRDLLNGLFAPIPKLNFSFFGKKNEVAPSPDVVSVKLSDLKHTFFSTASSVVKEVTRVLVEKGYYKSQKGLIRNGNFFATVIFMSVWSALFFGGFIFVFVSIGNPIPLFVGIVLSVLIFGIFRYLSPAKTEKGVAAKEYILGLKDYLRIAEKDRLNFHNAPERKPEVFEKLLPYAMVLGVVDIWTKEFEGIYTTQPDWYIGPSSASFTPGTFAQSVTGFSTAFATHTTPSGSGSSGGGSSGGGGGGSGGGSW